VVLELGAPQPNVFDVALNRAATGGIGLGFSRLTPADTSGPFVVQQLIPGAALFRAVLVRTSTSIRPTLVLVCTTTVLFVISTRG